MELAFRVASSAIVANLSWIPSADLPVKELNAARYDMLFVEVGSYSYAISELIFERPFNSVKQKSLAVRNPLQIVVG